MSLDYIPTHPSHESTSVFRDGDQLDMHAKSDHVVPYEEWQARQAVSEAHRPLVERPPLLHEIPGPSTRNNLRFRMAACSGKEDAIILDFEPPVDNERPLAA